MSRITKNIFGKCPYCENSTFDETLTEERRPGQQLKFCTNCNQWSVKNEINRTQYPLDDPFDKEGLPTISIVSGSV